MLKKFFRNLISPFAWHTVKVRPGWRYEENKITGQRRAIKEYHDGGYSGLDVDWVFRYALRFGPPLDMSKGIVYGPMPETGES